jgi:hypothetical protein
VTDDRLAYLRALIGAIIPYLTFVEVDETFVGGLAKNRHKDKHGDGSGGTGGAGKSYNNRLNGDIFGSAIRGC